MNTTPSSRQDLPSLKTLAIATGVAVLVAVLILIAVVLPAEYGMDPLGTGRRLGLNVMTAPAPEPVAERDAEGAVKLVPNIDGPMADYPGEFKVDAREFTIGPYEFLEFKYHLEKGATMVFSWNASDDLIHDFHGDTDGATKDEPQSYDDQPLRHENGSLTAPFTGIHGWFWENPGGKAITVKLTAAGFFTTAHEFHMDRTRRRRDVSGLDHVMASSAEKESKP
jgi:hypothetical protein